MTVVQAYQARFEYLQDIKDVDEAIKVQSQAERLIHEGDENELSALILAGTSYIYRFNTLGKIEDINAAVERFTRASSLESNRSKSNIFARAQLGMAYFCRFKEQKSLVDADNAIECLTEVVQGYSYGHSGKRTHLHNLAVMHVGRSVESDSPTKSADIDSAVDYATQAVSLTSDSHLDMPAYLVNLGRVYLERYHQRRNPADITEAVECCRKAEHLPAGKPSAKFSAACGWAQLSELHHISSPLVAWEQAVALLPHLVWLGNILSRRYDEITQVAGMIIEGAATAITHHSYGRAIEWLEVGRSIIWNQILQLRVSFDDIHAVDPRLALELKQVAHYLDEVNLPEDGLMRQSINEPSMEDAAQNHRYQAHKWEELLTKARSKPEFCNFLRPKGPSELAAAAQDGPVVIINVNRNRCDALVLRPGSTDVTHIPLTSFSERKALIAREQLSRTLNQSNVRHRRPVFNPQETCSEDHFESVLDALWADVAKPILTRLGYLRPANDPTTELPHVTWCTTGPLAFLPIHAAGRYDEPGARVYNHVVSSYTPNLSALLKRPNSFREFKGILAIGQEAGSQLTTLPGTVQELDEIQKLCKNVSLTRLEGSNAICDRVLDAMEQHSWVHFACHASQNTSDPTKNAFYLHDGPLHLARIIKKPLEHSQLAFLSACETAMGDNRLPEEAVHLAAGMLTAGFSTVIATMWSIKDGDAPLVAKEFYQYLLEGGDADSRRAAKGLHIATGKLRDEIGEKEFARWVPYIHLGH